MDEGKGGPTRSHGTKFGVVKLRNRLATYIEVQRFWGGSKTVMPSLQIYLFFMQLYPLFMHGKQFSKCPSINSRNCMLTKSSLLHSPTLKVTTQGLLARLWTYFGHDSGFPQNILLRN